MTQFRTIRCFGCKEQNRREQNKDSDHSIAKSHTEAREEEEESRLQGIHTGPNHEERDDEEEFNRIPIAGENEGDSVESWESKISWESENDGDLPCHILNGATFLQLQFNPAATPATSTHVRPARKKNDMVQGKSSVFSLDNIAFQIGPCRDGIIRRKDGTLITITETPPKDTTPPNPPPLPDSPRELPQQPSWSPPPPPISTGPPKNEV
jgi:hypothetical protein